MFFDIEKLKKVISITECSIQYDEEGKAVFQSALINQQIELEITQDMMALNTQPVIKLLYQPNTILWLERQINFLSQGCLLNIDLLSVLEEERAYLPFYQTHQKWLLPFFSCVLDWLRQQEKLLADEPINEVVESGLTWEKFD